jgi:hypothetical protein
VLEELRDHLDAHVGDSAEAPIFTTPTGDRVRLSNWRHRVWQPAATQLDSLRGRRPMSCGILRRASWRRAVCR